MKRVKVYRNITKGCYSIQDKKTRLVIAHAGSVYLKDAIFRVSEAGRQRVLREKRKNVHAFVEGWAVDDLPYEDARVRGGTFDDNYRVRYNPYHNKQFVDTKGRALKRAGVVLLTPKGVFAYGQQYLAKDGNDIAANQK